MRKYAVLGIILFCLLFSTDISSGNTKEAKIRSSKPLITFITTPTLKTPVKAKSKPTDPKPTETQSNPAKELLNLVNAERSKRFVNPVKLNSLLSKSAKAKADYIAKTGDFAHTSLNGLTGGNYMRDMGYKYSFRGENLARNYATPKEAFQGWLDSPTHYANIIEEDFEEMGVGVSGNIIVQFFGQYSH